MRSHLFLVRKLDEPFEEDNLIRIQVQPYPERAERVVVTLSCIVPFRKRTLGRDYLGPLQKSMLDAADWLLPFLKKNLEGQSSPFWESRSGDMAHPSPWSIHPVFETEQEPVLGAGLISNRTPYKNMFYCGPEAVPGFGKEGAAFAALETAKLVVGTRKIKKLL
jgi:hypothetical protein